MELNEKEFTIKVKVLPMKKAVLRQLPDISGATWGEIRDFKPICWVSGDVFVARGVRTWHNFLVGTLDDTPVVLNATQTGFAAKQGMKYVFRGEEIPFAVVL